LGNPTIIKTLPLSGLLPAAWLKLACSLLLSLLSCFTSLPQAQAQDTSSLFPQVPPEKNRHLNHLYEYESSLLGSRTPLVVIPGRAQEKQNDAWWLRVGKDFARHPTLKQSYKPYVFLYDSTQDVNLLSQEFHQELRVLLDELAPQQQVVLLTYSLGGLIARDTLVQHPSQLQRVHSVLGVSVPYHGSPMFNGRWFTHYLDHASPIRAFWDRLVYKAYFIDKGNLTRRMTWANFDGSRPFYAKASPEASKPTPAGFSEHSASQAFTVDAKSARQLVPAVERFKQKLIVHASYLDNPYTRLDNTARSTLAEAEAAQGPSSRALKVLTLPKVVLGSVLPFYGFTVHSVFGYMNLQLARLPVHAAAQPLSDEPSLKHLYRYNDGVLPLSSMLYLPERLNEPYNEAWQGLVAAADICKVRLFKGIDHVDMGQYRLVESWIRKRDSVHPGWPRQSPIEWQLFELERLRSGRGLKPLSQHCQGNTARNPARVSLSKTTGL
jgi:pimeloyl-ACP methyl ester carboxylesterase